MSQRSSAAIAMPSLGVLARRERRLQPKTRSFWSMAGQRFFANKPATAGLAVIAVMILLALGADLLSANVTGHTIYEQSLRQPYAPVGTDGFLLGTDDIGRDIATRLLYGGRVSLGVAGLSIAAALLIGATVGLVAGYFGGWVDGVLMRLVDVMLSVPTLFLLLLVATLWTMDPLLLALVIAGVSWTTLARLVRGEVLALREHEYVVAARVMGASDAGVMTRHMLPNVLPVMIVWGSLTLPILILAEATLSYLGLGIQPPAPSWGNMLSNAQRVWSYSAVMVLAPGLAIYATVFAINLVGSGLRDALDPRLTS